MADVLPPWKIPAEESNEQPQQQPGNTINHYEDTITRGMALTALRQAQQVASEFASLREHDGPARHCGGGWAGHGDKKAFARLQVWHLDYLLHCSVQAQLLAETGAACMSHAKRKHLGTILCGCRCLSCDHALAQVGTGNHSEQLSRHIPKQQLGLDSQHQSRSQLVKGQLGPQLAPGGWSRQQSQ